MNHKQVNTWLWSTTDIFIAILAAGMYLLLLGTEPAAIGLAGMLAMRITVKNFLILGAVIVVWTGIHQVMGLHSNVRAYSKAKLISKTVVAALLGSTVFLLFPLFSKDNRSLVRPECTFFLSALVLSLGIRLAARRSPPQRQGRSLTKLKTLIVGSGPIALKVYNSLLSADRQILGFVDSPGDHPVSESISHSLLGPLESLENILMSTAVDEVVVALPIRSSYDQIQETIWTCERVGVPAAYAYRPFEHAIGYSRVEEGLATYIRWVPSRDVESHPGKRALDLVGALIALITLSPLLIALAIAIKLTSPGPVFFVQERFGLNKRRFKMYKFRTMVPDAEQRQAALESQNEMAGPTFKIKNDPRITPIGAFLRKTSLDELPQFLNVLLGNMSLVGPRPLPTRDVSRFNDAWLMRRFSVKPGLTCLWQVHGRSNTTFDHWIALDLKYIDTWSPLLDFKILALTIPAILRGRGAM